MKMFIYQTMTKNIDNNISNDTYLNNLTLESFSCTNDDIAKVFHYLVKDKFIIFKKDCRDMCLYFDNKWNYVHLDEAYLNYDELYNYYKIVMSHYQLQLHNDIDETTKMCLYFTLKHVTKILEMLCLHAKRKHILLSLKSCYNPYKSLHFYDQLDTSNRKILGFENCVYDFTIKSFRQCQPTDMIMNICNYDYKTSSIDKQSRLKEILIQILTTQQNLDLFLSVVLNMLTSQNTKDNCLILHGKDMSGKSTIHNLIHKTFENLCKQIPSSKSAPNIRKLYSSELAYAKQRFLTTMYETDKSNTLEDCVNFMFDTKNKLEFQNMIIFSYDEPQSEKIHPLILTQTQFNVINLQNKFENFRDCNLWNELNNLNCAFVDILISNF